MLVALEDVSCVCSFLLKHVVSLLEYNIFITKLCCLTTLTPLISYTHNGDDKHLKKSITVVTQPT